MKTTPARIVPPFTSPSKRSQVRGACSTTVLLALLGLASIALGIARVYTAAICLGSVAVCLFLLIGCGIIPHVLAGSLQRSYSVTSTSRVIFGPSVCIVILGEGSARDPVTNDYVPNWIAGSRIAMGALLYRAAIASGAKGRILVTGERTRRHQPLSLNSYASMLIDLGVARTDVSQDNEGLNTYEHAGSLSKILHAQPAHRTFLVTSALHMKRALLYFQAFGASPLPFPSDYIHVPCHILPLGYNFAVTDIALHQYVGIIRFYVYESLGLNRREPPVSRPRD